MKQLYAIMVWMMLLTGGFSSWAHEVTSDSLILLSDSLESDTLNLDPEWYVAPVIPASLRAPMRTSAAAASCKTDSVLTFNVDSVLTDVTVYEYDEAGRTVGTLVWTCNTDGSRVGKSRTEDRYDASGTKTMTATYVWDNMTNDWKGNAKTEYEFANGKNTVTTVFDWLNGAWSAKTKYTYSYDTAGREIEYYEYSRNASLQLVYSKGRIREYNTNAKLIVEIQYTAHNGTDWSAGTKEVYDYDASGNQIEYTYYSSLSNGNWVGSTHEEWTYNAANKKTYYAKQTWKNGAWSNTSKEEYAYNAANKQTLKIVYTGSGTTWTESTKEVSDYNAAGSKTLSAKYKWKNGAWVGNGSRTETEYVGSKQSVVVTSSWSTAVADWIYATRHSYTYDGAGKTIADTTKTYTNSAWVNNALVTHVFDDKGNDTLAVTSAWNGENWAATSITKGKYLYTASGKPLLVETYMGLESSWTGKLKIEYAYNEAEEQTLYLSYDWYDGDWRYKLKNEKTYDAANHLLLNETYSWNNSQWVGSDKYEYAYDANGRQSMNTRYIWSNNAWKGISRTDKEFYSDGKEKTTISYTWSNDAWEGMFKYDYIYDQAGRTIERLISRFQNANWVEEQRYTYTFDARGQEIYSHEYRWVNGNWQMISAHEKTYDEADNKLRRDITGSWNTNGNVSSYTDMHYFYACDPHYYTIRFVNYDGTELSSESIVEGETPSYNGEEPTKPETAEYTYSFSGWTPSVVPVTGNATYTATFTGTKRSYTITWLNEDGIEIEHETLEYGATPAHADINKESTAEYTYTFAGWTPGIGIVTGDAEYTATYTATKNSYTITWKNEDGSVISTANVEYGQMPTAPADPIKPDDDTNIYTFNGWTPEITTVTSDAVYTATFTATKKSYTITWKNEDGSIIESETLEYGATPTHADINKESTAEWTYTFAGWSPEIVPVTGDATYTATFTATKKTYTITWKNEDGTVLQSGEVAYGEAPVYTGEMPSRPTTAEYTYTFAGWDKEVVTVTEAATYTATYTTTKNSYTITWKNEDGTVLQSGEVAYGEAPVYIGEMPSRPNTAENTYTFAGWSPQIVPVAGDAEYTATFTTTKNTYTITWKNEDGTVLQSGEVAYGEAPVYIGEMPSRPTTAEYTYTFAGWTPQIVPVAGDAEYTALFDRTKNTYTITWKNEDGTVLQSGEVAYGEAPVYTGEMPSRPTTAEYTYTFTGWSPEIVPVAGDAEYTATYTTTKNSYTITWKNEDGTVLQSGEVAYGEAPVYTGEMPSRPSTVEYTYTFAGWSPEIVPVTGDATYTATYTATERLENKTFTITFYYEEGSIVVDRVVVAYGETPSTNRIPSMPSDERYYYTFSGWSPEIVPANSDADYVATFTAIPKEYRVTFKNYNGRELQSILVPYGEMPEYTGEIPARPSNKLYTYTFIGWTPEITEVTGNATYTALFETVSRTQDVEEVQSDNVQIEKVLKNGILYIMYNGTKYNLQGQRVQ